MGDPDFVPPPNFDQRGTGFERVRDGDGASGAKIDIGAFELQQPVGPELPGDYNLDHSVDAADYVLWRKTLGTTGVPAYSGADGDGDTIDRSRRLRRVAGALRTDGAGVGKWGGE